jgi:hypothetical protein
LTERAPQIMPPENSDPIGAMIDLSEDLSTSSIPEQR